MASANRILAVVAIAAYLSAALLPCEANAEVFAPVPSHIGAHSKLAAVSGVASTPHASYHAAAHEKTSQSHAGHHGAHHHAGRNHASRNSESTHHPVAKKSALVWMPTCLCGCGDSRATVGGGAARLGPVVPPTPATAWPIEIARVATMPAPRPIPAPDNLIDPIPT